MSHNGKNFREEKLRKNNAKESYSNKSSSNNTSEDGKADDFTFVEFLNSLNVQMSEESLDNNISNCIDSQRDLIDENFALDDERFCSCTEISKQNNILHSKQRSKLTLDVDDLNNGFDMSRKIDYDATLSESINENVSSSKPLEEEVLRDPTMNHSFPTLDRTKQSRTGLLANESNYSNSKSKKHLESFKKNSNVNSVEANASVSGMDDNNNNTKSDRNKLNAKKSFKTGKKINKDKDATIEESIVERFEKFQAPTKSDTEDEVETEKEADRVSSEEDLSTKLNELSNYSADCKTSTMQKLKYSSAVFECSWEVLNQAGGIYTVLRTKAQSLMKILNNHFFVGPLIPFNKLYSDTSECKFTQPEEEWLRNAINKVERDFRLKVRHGVWTSVEGNPRFLLVEFLPLVSQLAEIKHAYWQATGISMPEYHEGLHNALMFGHAVGLLSRSCAEEISRTDLKNKQIEHLLLSCHEWMAGPALIWVRKHASHISNLSTMFTTHATLLARYLASDYYPVHEGIRQKFIDVNKEANSRQILPIHLTEKASAHLAHTFTAVSQVTADECEFFHERRPDFVTPNGINITKMKLQSHSKTVSEHSNARKQLMDFLKAYFSRSQINTSKTVVAVTAGRLEHRNKGFDMWIESLARLNHKIKECGIDITYVAFIIAPAPNNGYNTTTLKNMAQARTSEAIINKMNRKLKQRIDENPVDINHMDHPNMNAEDKQLIQNTIHRLQKMNQDKESAITTHNLVDDAKNPILSDLRRCELFNQNHDRVKVVYHADFLRDDNFLLGLNYFELIKAADIGVFPSYYEPWGYTPSEFILEGKFSITSNLAGFGCYISDLLNSEARGFDYGVGILDRVTGTIEDQVQRLVNMQLRYLNLKEQEKEKILRRTKKIASVIDWDILVNQYISGYKASLHRTRPDLYGKDEDQAGVISYLPKLLADEI